MKHRPPIPLFAVTILAMTGCAAAEVDTRGYATQVLPHLERYCYDCHADGLKKGGVALDSHRDLGTLLADRPLWQRIRTQVDFRLMPPPGEEAPTDAERERLLAWIDDVIFPIDPKNPDPGHVTIRRLNRSEYRNTIRDLLGVSIDVNELLPPDDSSHGFDNNGGTLSLSAAHLERYFDAAERALDLALVIGPMPRARQSASGTKLHGAGHRHEAGHLLATNGEVTASFEVSRPGRYRAEISASGTPGGDAHPRMELLAGGRLLHAWDVTAGTRSPEVHAHEWEVNKAGQVRVSTRFTNDFYDENFPDPTRRDRNLWIARIELIGPMDGPAPPKPATHRRVFGEGGGPQARETAKAYATRVIGNFARRAFRRPVTEDEVQRFRDLALQRAGGDIERGIRDALLAVLISPSFIYREEAPAAPHATEFKSLVSEFALASRLSYFIWGSMPDERLLRLAAAGNLRKNLAVEVKRMLASEKSSSLVTDFAGQWLRIRDLELATPDATLFPEFNRHLAADMRAETERLLAHVLRENLPVRTLLDADFTFLNERLAAHYGYPGVGGSDLRKMPLTGPRRGILGHASILTLTSHPTRTSPVIRGKYILDNILNAPPPPPPQNVPPLEPEHADGRALPLRAQLERHRADPACSSCHALIDPLGFGLENFDAIGRWREEENGRRIDSTGILADGRKFTGPVELLEILRRDPHERFLRAAAAKMLTYALGRGLEYYDRPAIDRIVSLTQKHDGRIHAMIHAITESVPFQYRRNTP